VLPVIYGTTATLVAYIPYFRPEIISKPWWFYFVLPYAIVAPFGALGAIFDCLRKKQKRWKHIAIIILVPLGFAWYYFGRHDIGSDPDDSLVAHS
jgi:hypothetical protein